VRAVRSAQGMTVGDLILPGAADFPPH